MNKMLTILIFVSIAINPAIHAQKNFIAGQIILENGDTLKGLINYRNWEINPRSVTFKSQPGSQEQTFLPVQLKSFEVYQQDQYVSAIVMKDMNRVEINSNVNTAPLENSGMVKDTVFLRLLSGGKNIHLYELVDKKTHFYIRPVNGNFEELQYRLVMNEDNIHFNTIYTFRDQLKRFQETDGNDISRMINKADYNSKDLIVIVRALNGSTELHQENTSKKKKQRFFLGGGVDYNSLSFPVDNQGLDVLATDNHLGFHLATGVDIFSERGFQKLFLRIGLAYSSWNYTGSGERTEFAIQFKKRYEYNVQMKNISPSLMIGYHILRNTWLNPYLGLEMRFNISSYPVNEYTKENLTTGDSETINNFINFENVWVEFGPRIGAVVNKFDINLYIHGAGTNVNYSAWKGKYNSTSLTVAYLF
ncbi:MAG: hypothetical protein ACJ75F_08970 [Flavisolibacter sp.]